MKEIDWFLLIKCIVIGIGTFLFFVLCGIILFFLFQIVTIEILLVGLSLFFIGTFTKIYYDEKKWEKENE